MIDFRRTGTVFYDSQEEIGLKSTQGVVFHKYWAPSIRIAVALGALSVSAYAVPVRYQLSGVQLSDGGTISGSFTFDADAGTPCSSGASPCGVYSNVSVVTTTGSARTGATYTFVCGQVATCTGVTPDSTEVMFLTSNAANQTGNPALALFFTAAGPVPPAGLSDASGIIDLSNTGAGVGQEASCSDVACSTPAAPARVTTAGNATPTASGGTIPTLSEWGLILFATVLMGYAALRVRTVSV